MYMYVHVCMHTCLYVCVREKFSVSMKNIYNVWKMNVVYSQYLLIINVW